MQKTKAASPRKIKIIEKEGFQMQNLGLMRSLSLHSLSQHKCTANKKPEESGTFWRPRFPPADPFHWLFLRLYINLDFFGLCCFGFGHLDGQFRMYGFKKHAGPRLESLLDFIHGQGYSAELAGPYGYPLFGEISLKREAIRAGLGKRGKSTVVLHPKYGPRLRFMAIRTDAPLEPVADSTFTEEENPVCDGCSICIDACPTKALEPYRMPDISLCLSNISSMTEDGRSVLCDICLHQCPAAKEG